MNINAYERIILLLNDNNYFNWLKDITEDKPVFYNIKSNLFGNDLSTTDIKNIKEIAVLFKGVIYYADNNFIVPKKSIISPYYYKIRYGNDIYNIGIMKNVNNIIVCKKAKLSKKDSYIDIEDVKKYYNHIFLTKTDTELSLNKRNNSKNIKSSVCKTLNKKIKKY